MRGAVAIVGCGVAGAACAFGLRRRGVDVALFGRGPGATGQSSGAVDWEPWIRGRPFIDGIDAGDETPELQAFAREVGWLLGPARVATGAGVVRPTHGRDPFVLDVGGVPATNGRRRILVPQVGRADFPAARLAREWTDSLRGELGAVEFVATELEGIWSRSELELPLAAFARRMDPSRLPSLLSACAAAARKVEAGGVLLGPWLGPDPSLAPLLRDVDVTVGETLSPPEGPAGPRLTSCVDSLVRRLDVPVDPSRVVHVETTARGVRLALGPSSTTDEFVALVLATGGLIGGGVSVERGPGGRPSSPLLLGGNAPSGGLDGFDATRDGGAWLGRRGEFGLVSSGLAAEVDVAGDVRSGSRGTLLGAVGDGLAAAQRVAERLERGSVRSP